MARLRQCGPSTEARFSGSRQRLQKKKSDDSMSVLKKVQVFNGLNENQMQAMVDSLEPVHFTQGQKIIKQGTKGDIFYIIKSGSVNCVDQSGQSADLPLSEGAYFGERALMTNQPRRRDVIVTSSQAICLALDRKAFDDIIGGSLQEVLEQNHCDRIPVEHARVQSTISQRTVHHH